MMGPVVRAEKFVVWPPFGLWLMGVLYLCETVNLRLPRVPVGSSTLAWNDVADGLVLPLMAALLARHNFSQLPFGLTSLPLLLLCLKLLGHGAHMSAFSMSVTTGVARGSAAAQHVALLHEGWGHWLGHAGELGLFACLVWRSSPKRAQSEDLGMEMPGHILAAVHGLAAGTHAIGTGTAPLLVVVWAVVAVLVGMRSRPLTTSVMRYAYIFCGVSLCMVAAWAVAHGGRLPTFDDVNLAATRA